jgi:hypothetical protein
MQISELRRRRDVDLWASSTNGEGREASTETGGASRAGIAGGVGLSLLAAARGHSSGAKVAQVDTNK